MIKHFFYFTALPIFIITSSCFCMKPSFHYEHTIDKTKRLFSIAFCNNKIFIAGTNGVDIYNNETKKLTKLSTYPTYHIAAHPLRQYLAISNEKELAIYNTQTEQKIWFNHDPIQAWKLSPITFTSKDNTIYAYYRGSFTLYNTPQPLPSNNFTMPFTIIRSQLYFHITSHPTRSEFLLPLYQKIVSISSDQPTNVENKYIFTNNNLIFNAEYNPTGDYIAIKDNKKQCVLYNIQKTSFHFLEKNHYISILFHPNRNIIALLNSAGAIEYWNYKNIAKIAVTKNYYSNPATKTILSRTKRLDFNQKGTYLAAALADTFLLLSVPNNNLVSLYFLLKQHHLPQDLIHLIISYFPDLFELQEINFIELSKT
jgi:WD40 repeat protein